MTSEPDGFSPHEELEDAEHMASYERTKAALTAINTEMRVMPEQHQPDEDDQ